MTTDGARRVRCGCVAAFTALTLVTTLSGCGTPRAEPASSSTASFDADIPPTPSASDYVSAVLNTRTRGSAKVGTSITIDTPAGQRALVGKGSTFLDPGYGLMTWSDDGASFVEMVNDEGIFVQSEQPDGRWTHYVNPKSPSPDGTIGTTATSGSADPLRGLGVVENVVDEGPESLGKVGTTRYSGYLPLTQSELRSLGLTEAEIAAVGDGWQGADERVTVWVDPNGFIVKIGRVVDLPDAADGPMTINSTATIGNFGSTLDVTSPSSDLIDTATSSPS